MKKLVAAIALALAGSTLNVYGQSAGGAATVTPGKTPGEGGAGGGAGHGMGEQHQLPSPEKIAEELMQKFDADMDGELSQEELTQALQALGEHRPRGGGGRHGRGGARGHGGAGGLGGPSGLGGASGLSASGAHGGSAGSGGSGSQTSSDVQGNADAQGNSDAQGENQGRPTADQIAAHLIEKFSSDKKGLKKDELTSAIREHRANRALSGGQQTATQPTGTGTP